MNDAPPDLPPAHPGRDRLALAVLLLVGSVILIDSVLGLAWLAGHADTLREAGNRPGLPDGVQWWPPLLTKLLYALLLLARLRWIFVAQAAWFLWYLGFAWLQASGADLPLEFYLGVGGHLFLAAIGAALWRLGILQGWHRPGAGT